MNDKKSGAPGVTGVTGGAESSVRAKRKLSAAAVSYDSDTDTAPKVLASGKGVIAERIIEIAREAGIPIQEDPALAEVLSGIDPGEEVPPETYMAIAEILVFIYRLDKSR
jgi:flagellar biosynthesis protein